MTRFEEKGCSILLESKDADEVLEKFTRSCYICCCRGLNIKCRNCAIETQYNSIVSKFHKDCI